MVYYRRVPSNKWNARSSVVAGLASLTLLCSSAAYGQAENVVPGPIEEPQAPAVVDPEPAPIIAVPVETGGDVYVPLDSAYRTSEPDRGFMQRLAHFIGYEWRERLFSPPLGSSLREHLVRHRVRGRAARAILYGYDFQPDSAELNQRGREQVRKIADWVTESGIQVVVEHTPSSPELALVRQRVVIAQLQKLGVNNASDTVIVGRPLIRGLLATEIREQAELQRQNSANRSTQSSGYTIGFGAGGSASGSGSGPPPPQQ